MRQTRFNTFETNSSSVNTMSLFRKDDWERFKNGELIMRKEYRPDPLCPGFSILKLCLSEKTEEVIGGYDYETMMKRATMIEELDGVIGICSEEYDY